MESIKKEYIGAYVYSKRYDMNILIEDVDLRYPEYKAYGLDFIFEKVEVKKEEKKKKK